MNTPTPKATAIASAPHPVFGYRTYTLGKLEFARDEYFAHIRWTGGNGKQCSHTLDIGNFLRALMRDVAWGFFYGYVNFDDVFGTCNHYSSVDVYAGTYNGHYKESGVDLLLNLPTDEVRVCFTEMLEDWTVEGFDPFAAPQETGTPYGRKRGDNLKAVRWQRQLASRCVGLKGDLAMRADSNGYTVNRAFADVPQDAPELHPEPGFEAMHMYTEPKSVWVNVDAQIPPYHPR
jgi:hypothetical protein